MSLPILGQADFRNKFLIPASKVLIGMVFLQRIFILVMAFGVTNTSWALPKAKKSTANYERDVKPLLDKYCYSCHGNGKKKGDLALDVYADESQIIKDRKTWELVLRNIRSKEMPPENKPQPALEEREKLMAWIEGEIFKTDCDKPDPGRVTLRRLNRTEYNNTIRDLVGVDFKPAKDFPADNVGYGFDNIGDVLSLSPLLLEKYLSAAEKVMNLAIPEAQPFSALTNRIEPIEMEATAPGRKYGAKAFKLEKEGDVSKWVKISEGGDYILRFHSFGQQAGTEPPKLEVKLDGKSLQKFEIKAVERSPKNYDLKLKLEPGEKKLSAAYINNYVNPQDPNPEARDRNLVLLHIEIIGPIKPSAWPDSYQRIFSKTAGATPAEQIASAQAIIGKFASKAFRRPVTKDEIARLMSIFEMVRGEGEIFEQGIKIALQAVLVSPHFLFRGEFQPDAGNAKSVHSLDDYALASRLSYFLWSSMPDEELFALAEKKAVRKNLEAQVKRMLKDSRSKALVENFADQWLQIRNLASISPDKKTFPDFDDGLRLAMQKETELFFESIMREDRNLFELLDANYSFLNGKLARHYGLTNKIADDAFQKVVFADKKRGGLLSQASILTITSNPTRTSPVKRGRWVLENILGTPPPPPPPDVPELQEGAELKGSLRQRMEQHRENASCASCHARMDPIGFGLENFDGIGKWRENDGGVPIEPGGQLVSGEKFEGPSDLRTLLVKFKREEFIACLSRKMLTYALGRGTEYYDQCALDEISQKLLRKNYKFSALIMAIVQSTPFQMRRGEGDSVASNN